MFEEHNKLTKTSYWLLAISSLVGFIFVAAILPQFTWDAPWVSYALAAALSLNFGMNVSVSFAHNSTLVTINLLAIAIFVVILLAYRSVIGANKSINYAPSAPDS